MIDPKSGTSKQVKFAEDLKIRLIKDFDEGISALRDGLAKESLGALAKLAVRSAEIEMIRRRADRKMTDTDFQYWLIGESKGSARKYAEIVLVALSEGREQIMAETSSTAILEAFADDWHLAFSWALERHLNATAQA